MPSFKEPSFQERTALANKARQAALDQLRAKPPVDEAALAARLEAAQARELAKAKVREEKLAARELLKVQKQQQAAEKLPVVEIVPQMTEEEQKAIRDAKYAARKSRKGKK